MKIPSENDILVYSMSAQVAPAYDKPNTKRDIEEMAIYWRKNFSTSPRQALIDRVVQCTRENVDDMNWALDDIEGVAWFLGKYVRMILKSGLVTEDFLGLMLNCMMRYFSTLNCPTTLKI